MALGFLIYAISYFFFGRYCNILVFIPLFIFYGIYSALADVNQKSLVSDITTPETKGTGFGLYHATLGLTLLPASFIGGWLYDNVNNQVPFYFGALTAVTASILMFWFFMHGTSTLDVKKLPKRKYWRSAKIDAPKNCNHLKSAIRPCLLLLIRHRPFPLYESKIRYAIITIS